MKKIFLANVTFIFAINIYSQFINDTVFYDKDWEQSNPENASYYRVISSDSGREIQYQVKDYYISGSIQMTGAYKSIYPDNKTGPFNYWYENGQSQIVCNYHNNKLDGEYFEYYDNGEPKIKRNYSKGLIDGEEKSWSLPSPQIFQCPEQQVVSFYPRLE